VCLREATSCLKTATWNGASSIWAIRGPPLMWARATAIGCFSTNHPTSRPTCERWHKGHLPLGPEVISPASSPRSWAPLLVDLVSRRRPVSIRPEREPRAGLIGNDNGEPGEGHGPACSKPRDTRGISGPVVIGVTTRAHPRLSEPQSIAGFLHLGILPSRIWNMATNLRIPVVVRSQGPGGCEVPDDPERTGLSAVQFPA
jgi:hypothetical protein